LKTDIRDIPEVYKAIFRDMRLIVYRLKDSNEESHDRLHFGVISQEVEELLEKYNIPALDFAAFCKDQVYEYDKDENGIDIPESKRPVMDADGNPTYIYSFRYQEMIPLIGSVVQDCLDEVDEFKAEVAQQREEISELKVEATRQREESDIQQERLSTMQEQLADALRRIEQLESR
jgi:hypothetical protein